MPISSTKTVFMPDRIRDLARDKRGLPIPFVASRNEDGTANFTVQNPAAVSRCATFNLCGICGGKLLRGKWFNGGPLSALNKAGAYMDPPTHFECSEYAMQVCPWLATPGFRDMTDKAAIGAAKMIGGVVMIDKEIPRARPKLFIALMAVDCEVVNRGPGGYRGGPPVLMFVPKQPAKRLRYWKDGTELTEAQAREVIDFDKLSKR